MANADVSDPELKTTYDRLVAGELTWCVAWRGVAWRGVAWRGASHMRRVRHAPRRHNSPRSACTAARALARR